MRIGFSLVLSAWAIGWVSVACVAAPPSEASSDAAKPPLGLPSVVIPEDNPQTPEKIALGRQLYFDPRLSGDNSVSCATCHNPKKGWSDGLATSQGVGKKFGGRNAPTVLNTAYQRFQFWDGRAETLEEQAKGPVLNPIEMSMPDGPSVEKKLNAIPGYRKQFQAVFGTDATFDNIAKAIAAFERTVIAGDSPYDRFAAGDKSALSDAAKRGKDLFFGKAHCSACHSGPNFTDNGFHNIGVSIKKGDKGRQEVSGLEGDHGSFKTPTLRDIARSGPYMHDGSMRTLEEVVEHYDKGGEPNPQLDEEIFELKLTDEQKKDLVTFLKEGLTSGTYPDVEPPSLP